MSTRNPRRIPLDLHGLSGRVDIFRLSGGVKRDAAVDRWLTAEPVEDPAGILQRSGKRMRHVKLNPGGALNAKALATSSLLRTRISEPVWLPSTK